MKIKKETPKCMEKVYSNTS